MKKIKILIADNSYLIRRGLCSIIDQVGDFSLVGEATKADELSEKLLLYTPDVLVIDYNSRYFCLDDLSIIRQYFPEVKTLAITYHQPKKIISTAIEYGVISHLLKDCGEDEIIESIYSTVKGEKFMCGKIIEILMQEKKIATSNRSCDGVKLSEREIEILQLIASGFANKQIADKLFISIHTVMTHRKHIMSKLKINNTASLVMYALQEDLITNRNNLSHKGNREQREEKQMI